MSKSFEISMYSYGKLIFHLFDLNNKIQVRPYEVTKDDTIKFHVQYAESVELSYIQGFITGAK